MIVVSDAGPLIALAKVGGLEVLGALHPRVLIPPAVHREAIEAGLRRGDADAAALEAYAAAGGLVLASPALPDLAGAPQLGTGERECIRLSIERRADWLLIDDQAARTAAAAAQREHEVPTQLRGTLGLIVAAHLEGHVARADAIALVERLRNRPDVWLSAELCSRVLAALSGASR